MFCSIETRSKCAYQINERSDNAWLMTRQSSLYVHIETVIILERSFQ